MLARKFYCRYVIASFPVTQQPIESRRSYTAHSPVDGLLGLGRSESGGEFLIVGQEQSFCPLLDCLVVLALPLVRIAECLTDGAVIRIEFECFSVLLDCLIVAALAVQGISQVLANAKRKRVAHQRSLAFCDGLTESAHHNQEKGIHVVYFVEPRT